MNDVDRLITDEYERSKGETLRTVASKLAAAGVKTSPADLEAPYNEAWHALYMKLSEGEEIGNRIGFLVTVTHRRALSEYRASRAGRRVGEEELDAIGIEFDLDAQMDAEIKVRHLVEGLRAGLSEREFEAATLCHVHGYTRPEAARAIGVKPKRMEKIMDGASTRIAAVIERVQSGEHCESMSSLIRAYAVGMLDPEGEKYELAQDHLAHCPACRRQVWVTRGLAAAVPPIPGIMLLAGGTASTAGVATGAGAGSGSGGSAGAGAGASAGAAADAGGKAGMIAAATAATAVAAVAAVGVVTGVVGGGDSGDDDPSATSPASLAAGETASNASAAKAAKAKAARAKAKAKARAERRTAERRQRQRQREAQAAPVAVAPVPEPVEVPPEPAYVPPPPPVEATPPPPPPPPPEKPTTNAGEEFGLR